MSIFPQIKFDKVTLTGGSRPIVVNNPHIDVTDGPLLLREGVFNKRDNFYDINIQLSAFENGNEISPTGILKNIEYLKYIKIAIFVSFYNNESQGKVPQNYTTQDIVSLDNQSDIKDMMGLILYDSLGLSNLQYNSKNKPEQYELFSFGNLIKSEEDYIKFQDDVGNYIIPINFTLKFPKETNHLQIFAVPFLDLEQLSYDYKLDLHGTISIIDVLEEPYYYTLNVISESKVKESDIIVNNILTEQVAKINLKLPKEDILLKLNIDKNKTFNANSISNLFLTKNEKNQDILYFLVNKKDLIIKNSPFYASFVNKEIPQIIKESLDSSTFTINLRRKRSKISKSNNKLGNQILSTKQFDKPSEDTNFNLSVVPSFIDDFDLYFLVGPENKENNTINSYELNITIKDRIVERLTFYYNILNRNVKQLQSYLKIVEIPYVKERTYQFNNPHIDLESSEREVTLPAFGFYDLVSNSLKNIQLLEQQLAGLNSITNSDYYPFDSVETPTQSFASKIENDLLNSMSFIIPLFNLDSKILEELRVLNLIKPETCSISTLSTLIALHQDVITSIGEVLKSLGQMVEIGSANTSTKKKSIFHYNHKFKDAVSINNYFNDFRLNNFVLLSPNSFTPYPAIDLEQLNVNPSFTPSAIKLFGNNLMLDSNMNANTDSARVVQHYYELINNNKEITQDLYSMSNKQQKDNYTSFASMLLDEQNCNLVYVATDDLLAKEKIDSFSYNFLSSTNTAAKIEKNNTNLLDKSGVLVNQLEQDSNEQNQTNQLKQRLKKIVSINKEKTFDQKVSDSSEAVDKLLTQLAISPTLNLDNVSITDILPRFTIEALVGFENNNLSLPIWQAINNIEKINNPLLCRLIIDLSQVTNKQLINKAINKLEYSNKYFIIGTQNV